MAIKSFDFNHKCCYCKEENLYTVNDVCAAYLISITPVAAVAMGTSGGLIFGPMAMLPGAIVGAVVGVMLDIREARQATRFNTSIVKANKLNTMSMEDFKVI